MKTYKRTLAAVTLVVLLSCSAIAGEIHTNGVVDPPPPPPETQVMAAEPGTETPLTESESILTEMSLTLIQLLVAF